MSLAIDMVQLNPAERLKLLEQLWDSLSTAPGALPLTNAQRDELDRRLDALDSEDLSGIPWDDVMQPIRSRTL